ncbi:hypothetical protein SteCoe_22523 [Stentor coeruleus]|uniref:EF-hand domain-containing protein n=1 Tax=Stentor coeruleus TaxID=5963 RepID=A0A1R2BM64_9CILI|nr:hypothetical protein SteCoe_22523 [Stentor coeruleus]
MGCGGSIKVSKAHCENLIAKEISLLKFERIKAIDFDRLTHRNSYNLLMSENQFLLVCKHFSININDPNINSFFMNFYSKSNFYYSVRELSALGILLGSGSLKEKTNLLFENYDLDSSQTLTKTEILVMLEDVCKISFQHLPTFAIKSINSSESEHIVNYQSELKSIKFSLIHHYHDLLFEDLSDEITKDQFRKKFEIKEILYLLSPESLRIYSKQILLNIQNAVKAVKTYIENPEALNSSTMSKLSAKSSKNTYIY